jgi:hypothetical protein
MSTAVYSSIEVFEKSAADIAAKRRSAADRRPRANAAQRP